MISGQIPNAYLVGAVLGGSFPELRQRRTTVTSWGKVTVACKKMSKSGKFSA